MPLDPRAIISGGENAKIEFKRDDRHLRPEHLAREIVAFANMNGGMIVLGVETTAPYRAWPGTTCRPG